jgi:pimeloyl-ACP methyl ester carboxylesterase
MTKFHSNEFVVDGVKVQVLEAGQGEPLVYFHGAGAGRGFDELLPLASARRLIVPIHPGFGASDDDLRITSVLDYVLHYAALFEQLKLGTVDLVGHSLGGWIASLFAILQGHRVRRLALACPAGLRVPEHPGADLFMIPPDKLAATLVSVPAVLEKMMAVEPTVDMKIGRYREMTSLARVIWERSWDPKLDRWLKRIASPTLLLWGVADKVLPVQQSARWAERLGSQPQTETFDGVGHLLFLETPESIKRVGVFMNA